MSRRVLFLVLLVLAGCGADVAVERDAGPVVEATSLLGEPLLRPDLEPETRERLERQLAEARREYRRKRNDPDALIWLGRRTAYLGRYREAIELFGEGIERFPEDARFYRHRGHRWITVREFERAIADLAQAAKLVHDQPDEVEPDGMPNAAGIPVSTLQTNIWYHLGLAQYLTGDFTRALHSFLQCLERSTNDDMLVAASDWLYMIHRRLGMDDEAERLLDGIHEEMEILENHAYHRRLLMYKGILEPEELLETGADAEDAALQLATQGYGVGNWYLYNGDAERAREIFEQIVAAGNWAAFGTIAAEAELRRMRDAEG